MFYIQYTYTTIHPSTFMISNFQYWHIYGTTCYGFIPGAQWKSPFLFLHSVSPKVCTFEVPKHICELWRQWGTLHHGASLGHRVPLWTGHLGMYKHIVIVTCFYSVNMNKWRLYFRSCTLYWVWIIILPWLFPQGSYYSPDFHEVKNNLRISEEIWMNVLTIKNMSHFLFA
jgi:hypothetical protein